MTDADRTTVSDELVLFDAIDYAWEMIDDARSPSSPGSFVIVGNPADKPTCILAASDPGHAACGWPSSSTW